MPNGLTCTAQQVPAAQEASIGAAKKVFRAAQPPKTQVSGRINGYNNVSF